MGQITCRNGVLQLKKRLHETGTLFGAFEEGVGGSRFLGFGDNACPAFTTFAECLARITVVSH